MFRRLYQGRLYHSIAFILLLSLSLSASPIAAQDTATPENALVDFMGTITGLAQNTMIVDNMYVVDLSSATINGSPEAGLPVHVQGQSQGNIIIAQFVEVVVEPGTATSTPTLTPGSETTDDLADNDVIVVIEGPVQEINVNSITIFNIDIAVDPVDPMLTLIQVGDVIHVEGNRVNGRFVAVTVGNIIGGHPGGPSVALEGPVQAINVNIITINNINIQLDPGDPILASLQIGDGLHVEGNFRREGSVFILVVVNVVIVNYISPDCRVSAMGMVICGMGSAMGG